MVIYCLGFNRAGLWSFRVIPSYPIYMVGNDDIVGYGRNIIEFEPIED